MPNCVNHGYVESLDLCASCFAGLVGMLVREELDAYDRTRRARCSHARSGTLSDEGTLTCDDCGEGLMNQDGQQPARKGA